MSGPARTLEGGGVHKSVQPTDIRRRLLQALPALPERRRVRRADPPL